MEPVICPGAHADHRAALGHLGVARELARNPRRQPAVNPGDLLLPGGRTRPLGVVIANRPVARESLAPDPVVRQRQVEHRRHQLTAHPDCRHPAAHDPAALALPDVKTRQVNGDALLRAVDQRQRRLDRLKPQVPTSLVARRVAVPNRAVGHGSPVRSSKTTIFHSACSSAA